MDYITNLPLSNNYICILLIIDHFTKYNIYMPLTKSLDTKSLSNVFIRDHYKRFNLLSLLYLIELKLYL
jgi:small neutral amino acid transporter SnatA (MarC family)